MPAELDSCCEDLNAITRWLACERSSEEQARQSLAIVLLGNQVLATFDAACELASRSSATPLVFSGGIGHSTRALFENFETSPRYAGYVSADMSEAEMYAAAAEKAWLIARPRMLPETRSLNCGQNARYSLRVLKEAGVGDGPILLLQDPLMLRRSTLTWEREAELAGMNSQPIPHAAFVPRVEPGTSGLPQLISDQAAGSWSFERFLGIALGEVDRLRDDESGYGPKGKNFFRRVDVPAGVEAAFQRITAGPLGVLARR